MAGSTRRRLETQKALPSYNAIGATSARTIAYRKAEKFILDELESRGFFAGIIPFNDGQAPAFDNVRDVTCKALKRAVKAEALGARATPRRGKHAAPKANAKKPKSKGASRNSSRA